MYQNNELMNSNEMETLKSPRLRKNLRDAPHNFYNKATISILEREVESVFKPLPSQWSLVSCWLPIWQTVMKPARFKAVGNLEQHPWETPSMDTESDRTPGSSYASWWPRKCWCSSKPTALASEWVWGLQYRLENRSTAQATNTHQ